MKKLMLSLAAVISLSSAFAQKGSVLYWGNIGGDNNSQTVLSTENSHWSILVNQGVGYQFSKHITVGLQGGYSHSKRKSVDPFSNPSTHVSAVYEYGVGAFGRYTAYLGDRLFVYLQADAGYNRNWAEVTPPYSVLGADLFPAVGFEVYKGWAINANIGAIALRHFADNNVSNTTLSYNLGQSFTFGISKNFRCSKSKPASESKG